MLEIGSVIDGRYEIISLEKEDDFTFTYLAVHKNTMRILTIKEYVEDCLSDGLSFLFCGKFKMNNEAYILRGIDRPDVPRVIDIIFKDRHLLSVMEHINGMSFGRKRSSVSRHGCKMVYTTLRGVGISPY